MEEAKQVIKLENPDIVAIVEVKPKNYRYLPTVTELSIEDYYLYEQNLEENTGRGIVCYCRKGINVHPISRSTDTIEPKESLWICIKSKTTSDTVLGICYRSPNNTNTSDEALFSQIAAFAKNTNQKLAIIGDFNLPKIDWNRRYTTESTASLTSKFLDVINEHFLEQLISEPTRMRGSDTPSILDLLLVSDGDLVSDIKQLSPIGKSDHSVIVFSLETEVLRTRVALKRNYYKGDYVAMRRELSDVNWIEEFSGLESLDTIYTRFTKIVASMEEQFIPMHNKYTRVALPKANIELIKAKQKAWRDYKSNRLSNDREKTFKRLRNRVRKATRREGKLRERKLAFSLKENPKIFWKYVNSKRKNKGGVSSLYDPVKQKLVHDPMDKANFLNSQFSSVFTQEPENEDHFSREEPIQGISELIRPIEIKHSDVLKKLRELNPSKSTGPDNLHPKLLKELATVITEPLVYIYRKSLELGELPTIWKKAIVVPIYKGGKREDPSNYRPISLTCITCKVLESLIADHTLEHLKREKILTEKQFGFLKERSAEIQLLCATDDWKKNIDKGFQIDLIYLDLKKAFDKVPHKRLVKKLRKYGLSSSGSSFSLLQWITDFLTGRKQVVCVEGCLSNAEEEVLSGVPQGSILGPLLFNLYINDLVEGIKSDILLYADDTKLYRVISSCEDIHHLQADLQRIDDWMKKWIMEINTQKSHILTLGPQNFSSSYFLGSAALTLSREERDLGILVDSELNFSSHYEAVVKKASKVAGMIRRNFSCEDDKMLATLYKSLVRPILEYGHCSTRPYYNKDIDALENVQRRITKFSPRLRFLPYEERLRKLEIPTLAYRFHRGDLIEMYKLCNGAYDNVPAQRIVQFNKNHLRGHQYKVSMERFYKDMGRWTFGNRVVQHWNNLPERVICSTNLRTFKKEVDEYYSSDIFSLCKFRRNAN